MSVLFKSAGSPRLVLLIGRGQAAAVFRRYLFFPERIQMEHKDEKSSSDIELQIHSICSIRTCSRSSDIIETVLQRNSNPYVT